MTSMTLPPLEDERIAALKKYSILDTPPDGTFDRITALASKIFKVPIAIISLVDTDRIWFKSHYGLSINQLDREPGLCASAILSNEAYVIENAKSDPRSLSNPLVAGEFGLQFYAAVPLKTDDNHNLGTFCIIDKHPRTFSNAEKEILQELGEMVMHEMRLRLALRDSVLNIRNLTTDISSHLKDTLKSLKTSPGVGQMEKIQSYLDASRMFLLNVDNQLNQL